MKHTKAVPVMFIVVACFLSRVAFLLSPGLMLDGDECVTAIMAKHLSMGKSIPLFFYGQNYGFSFIEVVAILPFYTLLGVSALAVKLAMLCLWTVGVVFFYLSLRQIKTEHKWLPMLITLLLIVSPGWMVHSVKALGGYLTAFMCSNIALYLLLRDDKRYVTGFLVGVLLSIVFQAQVLWMAGLAPYIGYRLLRDKSFKKAFCLLLPFVVITIAFYFYKETLPRFWIAGRFNPKEVLVPFIARIPKFVYYTMHGYYDVSSLGRPGMFSAIFAWVLTAITLLVPVAGIAWAIKVRRFVSIHSAAALSVILAFSYSIFTYYIEGRYLLPLIAYTLLALCVFLSTVKFKRFVYASVLALNILGLISVLTYKEYRRFKASPKTIAKVLDYLQRENTRHVYCTHGMLTWQIIFYSDEQVLARTDKYPGRYPLYTHAVDKALSAGERTVVMGYIGPEMDTYTGVKIIGDIFVAMDPSRAILSKQFEFKEGEIFKPY